LRATLGDDPDTLAAASRYDLIAAWAAEVVQRHHAQVLTPSDRLDRVLTHPWLGVPIFLGLMWVVFQITANASAPFLDWIDGVISGPITRWAAAGLGLVGLEETWLGALLLEGVIAGVGGVLVFVPVLVSLYLCLAVLEDSGYMARAAFVMDRFMHRLGLQGKSFLPLLVGFGCNVPAVYATRTLDSEADRKITGFLVSFMSCGARLPVYVTFGAIFFGGSGAFIFAMYLTGIGVALLTSFLLTRFVYRGKAQPPFVIELPPYRTPNPRVVLRSTWQRTASFVRNAGTLILVASLVIWLLMAIPAGDSGQFNQVAPRDSLFGRTSAALAPALEPAGFGTWQSAGSLLSGLVAKEVVISSMSQIYSGEEAGAEEATPTLAKDLGFIFSSLAEAVLLTGQELLNIVPRTINLIPGLGMPELELLGGAEEAEDGRLSDALAAAFTPLSAVAFNVFVLLYVPCMAAVGAMRHEFGWRWTLAQVVYTLGVAWLGAVLVYQVGSLLGAA
ncbi:MAG: ferrous iron transport protein B, partial [Anaerolineae bacterium]|nr:ferrous iron transport protein B [Anaerolineae bacterium]